MSNFHRKLSGEVGLLAAFASLLLCLPVAIAMADSCSGFAPEPGGTFPVASVRFDARDASRRDQLDDDTDAREFTVDAYYPAASPGRPSPYAEGNQRDVLLSAWPLEENVVYQRCLRISPSSEASREGETFPVIIFSHGLSWPAAVYRSLLIDLASHGYVVLAITHTHAASLTAFENGRQVDMSLWPRIDDEDKRQAFLADYLPEWISDIQYLASLLRSDNWRSEKSFGALVDPGHPVGLMGHSYGASATARALDGKQLKVAFIMEGRYRGSASETQLVPDGVIAHVIGNYNRLELEGNQYRPGRWPVYEYVVNGAWHASFSDLVMLYRLNATDDWKERHFNEIDPERAVRITTRLASAFFDAWMKGKDSAYLHPVSYGEAVESPRSGGFPEVELTIDVQPVAVEEREAQ